MRPTRPTAINLRRRALLVAMLLAAVSPALRAQNQKWQLQPSFSDPELRLLDQDGKSWRLFEDLIRGRTVVVNFIYTDCLMVCPTQTAMLRELRKQLDEQSREVLLLSLTVDPLNNQPQQLRDFARDHGLTLGLEHGWIMLTGSMPAMKTVLKAFNADSPIPGEHPDLLWVGNEPRQRWTRSFSINTPPTLLRLINEVQE